MSFNLGFIGGGNMSSGVFKGILKSDDHLVSKIWVAGPRLENLQHWKDLGANITTKNGEVVDNCDIIFLGVKPGILSNAIAGCSDTLSVQSKSVLFVSMLVGISIENIHKALKVLPVQSRVIRILPNTPMAIGAGSCLYTEDDNVTKEQCTLLEKLLKGCGVCERVPESLMDNLGILTGCGPAFMYIVIEALADGAVKQGVPRATAIRHAAQMVVGSGEMVLQTGKHPAVLKDEVCSPGGCTICGVAALESGKLRATLINAIEAAVHKTKEIGKK